MLFNFKNHLKNMVKSALALGQASLFRGVVQDRYYFVPHVTIGKIMNKNDETDIDILAIPPLISSFVPISFALHNTSRTV